MNDSDKMEFSSVWGAAWSAYGKSVTPQILGLFFNSLKHYEMPEIKGALSRHFTNPDSGQFAPKPADIVKYLQGGTNNQALAAWSKVDKAIRQVGPYQDVVFDDALIHAVLSDMGGWIAICDTKSDEDLRFRGNEFEKRYRGYVLSPPSQFPKKLTGLSNKGNSHNRKRLSPPVMIGNQQSAEQVYIAGKESAGLRVGSLANILDEGVKALSSNSNYPRSKA